MTPTFMGSEPMRAEAGKYAGTTVLQDEQNKGLALMQALTPEQQKKATLQPRRPRTTRWRRRSATTWSSITPGFGRRS